MFGLHLRIGTARTPCPEIPEEGVRPPGTGVTGNGRPAEMDAGSQTQILYKSNYYYP